MRYITVPSPVELENYTSPDGGHPKYTLSEFVRKTLVLHQSITQSNENLTRFEEIAKDVKDVKPGDVWVVEDKNHEFLESITKSFNYAAETKLSLIPLMRAITGAPKNDPRGKKVEPDVEKTE